MMKTMWAQERAADKSYSNKLLKKLRKGGLRSKVTGMPLELTPWKPFRDIDELWERFFRELSTIEPFRQEWIPFLDVSESENNIVVKAELPGIDPKEIDITLNGGLLTIKGEKKQEKEEKGEKYHSVERSYGAFTRSVRLPRELQNDTFEATFKNGVLKISLTKSEEAKKKDIKIQVE